MTLPTLTDWMPTASALHRASALLSLIHLLRLPHVEHFIEIAVPPQPDGLSTERLPGGSIVHLNYRDAALIVQAEETTRIPLQGHTQASLLAALLDALAQGELADLLADVSSEKRTDHLFEYFATTERPYQPQRADYTDATPFDIDVIKAGEYAHALWTIFTGIAQFRARLNGVMTPLVVYPHGFDLSMLWFGTKATSEQDPHMNFGFAPFSRGIDYPYLYAYAHPLQASHQPPMLPDGARWHTTGWTGVVLPYDEIARQADPARYVEMACMGIYNALLGVLA